MKPALALLGWLGRTLAILLLVLLGSTVLVRFAPGYLSDAREMDSRYAAEARSELSAEAARSRSFPQMAGAEIGGWLQRGETFFDPTGQVVFIVLHIG